MFEAKNLRTTERFLLVPPVPATFGELDIAICDISLRGARFRHAAPVETGLKSVVRVLIEGRSGPISLEGVVVWSQTDPTTSNLLTGVRTYASEDVVRELLDHLHYSRRSNRIEELRSADRFLIAPSLEGRFGEDQAFVEDLSARGARIETSAKYERGEQARLTVAIPESPFSIDVPATVQWSRIKSISQVEQKRYVAGLSIAEKPELIRLAIGRLAELNRATLDTSSLRLKLKIFKARARQNAIVHRDVEESGIPAEQFFLVQGVREELRVNPDEAMFWYRRARIAIADPATRQQAPAIADHPDALAVWEYLDRSIDPTIIGRTFAWES